MSQADPTKTPTGPWTLDLIAQGKMLGREWASMFRPQTLLADFLAGVAVSLVALPLSLAIANSSQVTPTIGLTTAIVAGITVALFGGCRLQVSGPAAAMTFLVAEIVIKFGLPSLVAATFIAGFLQLIAGYFRLGRIMQFFPRPVIAGFLTGIGITIICVQLPKILGYDVPRPGEEAQPEAVVSAEVEPDPADEEVPDQTATVTETTDELASESEGAEAESAVAVLWHTIERLPQTHWPTVLVGLSAFGSMLILPRISRKIPTPLVAVVLGTVLPMVAGFNVVVLGKLPEGLPMPQLPVGVDLSLWNDIALAGFAIFFLASIESLLSASVVTAMSRESRVDNDQELIGQGLGNLASALFGGIPVTGVIARSATNIQAGARTRLSAIIHALILLAMLLFLGPLVERIPIAALAGVLCAVGLRMIEVRLLRTLWNGSRAEALVYLTTAGSILVTDLIVGVPIGLVAAFFYFVAEMSRLNIEQIHLDDDLQAMASEDEEGADDPAIRVLRVRGPLFFASGFHLLNLLRKANDPSRRLLIDLHQVPMLDVTGAEILEEAVELVQARGGAVALVAPTAMVRQRLSSLTQERFDTLRACPIYDTMTVAIRDSHPHLEPPTETKQLVGS